VACSFLLLPQPPQSELGRGDNERAHDVREKRLIRADGWMYALGLVDRGQKDVD
jgi:hypothetical protein